jgi:hypothetical protein
VAETLRTHFVIAEVAACRRTGWQHNFAQVGRITLHWVAELIAFSTLVRKDSAFQMADHPEGYDRLRPIQINM